MRGTSIFRKMLLSYLSVLLAGFALLAVLLSVFLQHFLINQKETVLFQQADDLVELIQKSGQAPAADPLLTKVLASDRRLNQIRMDVWLADELNATQQYKRLVKRLLQTKEIRDLSMINRVKNGQRVKSVGTFTITGKQVQVTVGVPIQDGGKVIGALFLHSPVQEMQIVRIVRLILWVALGVALLAVLTIYFISRKISRPLIHMNQVAHSMGQGNFKARVEVAAGDEVGQLAHTLNDMAHQLDQLESMRKDLITNVSHELRTPLTSVKGFVQGILEGKIPPDQQHRYMETVYGELDRLHTLVNTMLDLSAIESGRLTVEKKVIRWSSLVDSVVDSVQVRTEEKSIGLSVQEEAEDRLRVVGDPERLKQVLFNLLDNAIRHTPAGGKITISSRLEGAYVKVRVADTGEGIPSDKLSRIWERFYMENASRMSGDHRSGLGLTITKQLIELMNGRIEVASKLGEGTVFTLLLPIPQ